MNYHKYMNVRIMPMPPNAHETGWHAYGPKGYLQSQTLQGIKDMIRSDHEQVLRERREALQVHRAHKAIMDNIWSNSND